MANNPVQIVINSGDYVADMEGGGGGPHKDFFAHHDAQFIAHQTSLTAQLGGIRAELASSGRALGYAKVVMRPDAWAKSHRPTDAVFREAVTPTVGVSDLGELLVEVTTSSIEVVSRTVASAEPETRITDGPNGRPVAKPTRTRSEVGGIASVRSYGPSDRRSFSSRDSATWLSDPRTGGYLLVQFFEDPTALADQMGQSQARRQIEFTRLKGELAQLDSHLVFEELEEWWTDAGFLALPMNASVGRDAQDLHESVLEVLDSAPLIRKIWLPPIATQSSPIGSVAPSGPAHTVDAPVAGRPYPIVGVIDTGVSTVGGMDAWIIASTEVLDPSLQDMRHGTFIGGLLTDSGRLNSHPEMLEDACKIFDLGLHATDPTQAADVYPNGFADFLQQLEFEIQPAVEAGVRVFNMSLAVTELVRDDSYSPFAARIDAIADRYDIIFVLPSGNLEANQFRAAWPTQPAQVLSMLANYRHQGRDRLYQPGESIRAVTVGALDPQLDGEQIRPSNYSRRGPGVGLGHKPDLSHIGGAGSAVTGLTSMTTDGTTVQDCGTSFASPNVAKTLANVEEKIEGAVRRETIVGLTVHGAVHPPSVADRSLLGVARDFVGFGLPALAQDLLTTDDHGITMVFEASLMNRKALDFSFQWPRSLVGAGSRCRGTARLTLVYRPPLDLRYGSETVRVNLEAYLRQEKIDPRTGEVTREGFFKSKGIPILEKERVSHGQKWGAVKQWNRTSKGGVGNTSQWQLVVEPLARSGVEIPVGGIPFTALLTISDPSGAAPVFNQMRNTLQANNVQINDIRTAQRIRPRN